MKRTTSRAFYRILTAARRSTPILLTVFACFHANGSMAAESPGVRQEAAWYMGYLVTRLAKLNDPSPLNSPDSIPDGVQPPMYTPLSPGMIVQTDPVIGVIPGDPGYTGWWQRVILLDVSGVFAPGAGRDVLTDPYTSAEEVEAALCENSGVAAFYGCFLAGTPLVDISELALPPDFGPLNAQIINTPPALGVCLAD